MPLVTRQADTGRLIVQTTAPASPADGELWNDIGQNPPILKSSDSGTFRPTMQSGVLVQGDINIANANNELGRLAIGTARQQLATNSGTTAPEWVASLQSLLTGTGDIIQSSGANTPARLPIGAATQVMAVNAGATALEYVAAASGSLERLDTHLATGTESTYTFTPATALNEQDYSEVKVIYSGEATATFVLNQRWNTIATSSYRTDGTRTAGGSTTIIDVGNTTGAEIASSTIMSIADGVYCEVTIHMQDSAFTNRLLGWATSNGSGPNYEVVALLLTTQTNELSAITTLTSTSTWKAGTKIDTFGVQRT